MKQVEMSDNDMANNWARAQDEYDLSTYVREDHRQFVAQVFANCDDLQIRDYSGRGGYEGPGVVVDNLGEGLCQIARATTEEVCGALRWDTLGRDYIVYPG